MANFNLNINRRIGLKDIDLLDGQTESAIINLQNEKITYIVIPASFTGTSISFKVDSDGTSSNMVAYNNASTGALISITVTAGESYAWNINDFAGVMYLQIVSNASQTGDVIFLTKTVIN